MRKKKLLPLILLILLMAAILIPVLSGCNNNTIVLKVYNAQDYIDESVLGEFEEYCLKEKNLKVKIQYDTFDTLERAYTIINNRKADYDVMCPSDYIIEKMKKNDLLTPLNKERVPNIENIPPFLRDRNFDPNNEYSVPYMWGTVGILYNADKVDPKDVKGWDLLWNKKYNNKILMKDSIRDSVFIATIYAYREELAKIKEPELYRKTLDELVNNITDEKLKTVEKELREQYNILYAYEVDSGKDAMTNGEAYVNLAWSGDAVWAIEEAANNKINLDFYIPEEGSNIWFDNWVIPKYSKNVDLAHEFINFVCDPEIALRNMDETGYTTAVMSPDIIDYMSDEEIEAQDYTYLLEDKDGNINESFANKFGGVEFFSNLRIPEVTLPSKEKADYCVEMTDFGEKQDSVVKMWTRVKALPLGVEVIIFSICLLIAIVGIIAYSIYKRIEKRKLVEGKIEQINKDTNNNKTITHHTYFTAITTKIKELKYQFSKKEKTADILDDTQVENKEDSEVTNNQTSNNSENEDISK